MVMQKLKTKRKGTVQHFKFFNTFKSTMYNFKGIN